MGIAAYDPSDSPCNRNASLFSALACSASGVLPCIAQGGNGVVVMYERVVLTVIMTLEFFQHHFAKMSHRNASCDSHLHQAIEQPMRLISREASAAGRLRPNAVTGKAEFVQKRLSSLEIHSLVSLASIRETRRPPRCVSEVRLGL